MIDYCEETDYGQAILEICAEINSLMDPLKEYTKKEITATLRRISTWTSNLKHDVEKRPVYDCFFTGCDA